MLAEIATVLSTATGATKLLSSLREVVKDSKSQEEIFKVQTIITDLQAKVIDVHAKYMELLESKNVVEAALKEYRNWDNIASTYAMTELARGSIVYSYKPTEPFSKTGKFDHYVCPNCFTDRKISVLQGIDVQELLSRCPKCNFETQSLNPVY